MRKIIFCLLFMSLASSLYAQRYYLAGERVIGISNLGAGRGQAAGGTIISGGSIGFQGGYFLINNWMVGANVNLLVLNNPGIEVLVGPEVIGLMRYYVSPDQISVFGQLGSGINQYFGTFSRTTRNPFLEVLIGGAYRPSDSFSLDATIGFRRYFGPNWAPGFRTQLLLIPKLGANYHF